MALYSIDSGKIKAVEETTFTAETVLERQHLQKRLMVDTQPLGEDLFVLCEEFGNWEDSHRRIDLLCLDKQGCLVVVEIKRTEDGGHMELQAIRYAAMVSSMTMDQAVAAHAATLKTHSPVEDARKAIAEYLGVSTIDETAIASDVRIVLVASNFSSEITTAVIWLNQRDLDIRCVRLRPYKMSGQLLIDATQILPLPEAADYAVKIKEKVQEAKKVSGKRQELLRKFWTQHRTLDWKDFALRKAYSHNRPLAVCWYWSLRLFTDCLNVGRQNARGNFYPTAEGGAEQGRFQGVGRSKAPTRRRNRRRPRLGTAGAPLWLPHQ